MTWIVWLNFMLTLVNFRWWIRGRWLAVLNCIKAYTCSRRFVLLTHKFLLHPFVFLSLGLLRVKCYCCGSSKFSLCCKILISLSRSRKNLSLINAKLVNWLNTFVRCIPGLSTNPHSPSPLYGSKTWNGARWFVSFIDDHTRITWIFLMKHKS